MDRTRILGGHSLRLEKDPSLRRQFAGPLMLLWGPPVAGERREGLGCYVQCCANPDCGCRDAHVLAVEVDDRLVGLVSDSPRDLALVYPPDQAPDPEDEEGAELTVDIDTGKVVEEGRDDSPRVVEAFRAQVDAGLLEALRRRHAEAKRPTADWRLRDWSGIEPGMMVGWEEVFPEAADTPIVVKGRELLSFEDHCIDPGCDCDEVRIGFVELSDHRGDSKAADADVGVLCVSLANLKVKRREPAKGKEALLQLAWDSYSAGPGLRERLAERDRKMKQIGPELRRLSKKEPERTGKKVGANEPCPCGSGRKFKRCCMLGAAR